MEWLMRWAGEMFYPRTWFTWTSGGQKDALRPLQLGKDGYLDRSVFPAPEAWTAELKFGGANTGMTYTARSAYAVKVGPLAFFTLDVRLSAKGSSTGLATITGLPWASGAYGHTVMPVKWLNMTSTLVSMMGMISSGASAIELFGATAAAATLGTVSDTAFSATSIVQISGCYMAA